MKAAILNNQGIVENVIIVNELSDVPGCVECNEWVGIGDPIDIPAPEWYLDHLKNENKKIAESKLAATDWVNEPDVYEITYNPHLLNREAYLEYRSIVRGVAINPVAGTIDWPIEPTPQWSSAE